MKKCSQKKCEEDASYTYTWPGEKRRQYACIECFLRAYVVAKSMGFPLGDARVMTPEEMEELRG